MARKRKRAGRGAASTEPSGKRQKLGTDGDLAPAGVKAENVHHPSLSPYYSQVLSLRAYLLAKLPRSSRARRRRLASLGRASKAGGRHECDGNGNNLVGGQDLVELLDTTLVGMSETPLLHIGGPQRLDRTRFSQPPPTMTSADITGLDMGSSSQVEVRTLFVARATHPDYRLMSEPLTQEPASDIFQMPPAHRISRSSTMPSGYSST